MLPDMRDAVQFKNSSYRPENDLRALAWELRLPTGEIVPFGEDTDRDTSRLRAFARMQRLRISPADLGIDPLAYERAVSERFQGC